LVAKIFKDRQKDRRLVLKMQVYRALGYLRRLGNVIDGSLAIPYRVNSSSAASTMALGLAERPALASAFLFLTFFIHITS